MALKNFIKQGTYSRINNIQWLNGYPALCIVATYEKKADAEGHFTVVENQLMHTEDDGTEHYRENYVEPPEPMAENKVDLTAILNDVDLFNTYFANDKWTASDSNLHAQLYKYMLTLPLFSEASTDQ